MGTAYHTRKAKQDDSAHRDSTDTSAMVAYQATELALAVRRFIRLSLATFNTSFLYAELTISSVFLLLRLNEYICLENRKARLRQHSLEQRLPHTAASHSDRIKISITFDRQSEILGKHLFAAYQALVATLPFEPPKLTRQQQLSFMVALLQFFDGDNAEDTTQFNSLLQQHRFTVPHGVDVSALMAQTRTTIDSLETTLKPVVAAIRAVTNPDEDATQSVLFNYVKGELVLSKPEKRLPTFEKVCLGLEGLLFIAVETLFLFAKLFGNSLGFDNWGLGIITGLFVVAAVAMLYGVPKMYVAAANLKHKAQLADDGQSQAEIASVSTKAKVNEGVVNALVGATIPHVIARFTFGEIVGEDKQYKLTAWPSIITFSVMGLSGLFRLVSTSKYVSENFQLAVEKTYGAGAYLAFSLHVLEALIEDAASQPGSAAFIAQLTWVVGSPLLVFGLHKLLTQHQGTAANWVGSRITATPFWHKLTGVVPDAELPMLTADHAAGAQPQI